MFFLCFRASHHLSGRCWPPFWLHFYRIIPLFLHYIQKSVRLLAKINCDSSQWPCFQYIPLMFILSFLICYFQRHCCYHIWNSAVAFWILFRKISHSVNQIFLDVWGPFWPLFCTLIVNSWVYCSSWPTVKADRRHKRAIPPRSQWREMLNYQHRIILRVDQM